MTIGAWSTRTNQGADGDVMSAIANHDQNHH